MNGSKRARNTPSISCNTKIFGIMGGSAPRIGINSDSAVYRYAQRRGGKSLNFLFNLPVATQKAYLAKNKLLSVNPLASGGVGKKVLLYNSGN